MADAVRTKQSALLLMRESGGDFASKLATAWLAADPANEVRLDHAFAALLVRYQSVPEREGR